ncbi:MAG: quinol monooxygenase YgiN [Alcanivorax sp.]|jgi:quinol monooxygenase YgiN
MTIVIAGTLDIGAGNRDKVLIATASLVADTRSQQGCSHYVWAADPTSDTRVYVYENWDSTEDLAAHLAGPYYLKMLTALGEYGVENVEISKFRVDLQEPVYDETGTPRADFFTA